ncbi:putative redox protein [Saccharicrinis carchari]|uniref:Putative redox protein n=1 Tax=Saccharicrinis carchari TaxID=1168039 RepID=A0A521CI22_SACCC|nr:OsmC family protein [Saccharicrinis carchari]SMO59133.1 putative redox protein [Saccharicrinis carchari]
MKTTINLEWIKNISFKGKVNGHDITIDAGKENGGDDSGIRPKPLMLVALAGCTGIDVVNILNKMRVEYDSLNISVEANMREEHPKYYDSMKIIYHFKGKKLPMEKLKRAVQLSEEQYCGVSALYKMAIPVSFEIKINEQK